MVHGRFNVAGDEWEGNKIHLPPLLSTTMNKKYMIHSYKDHCTNSLSAVKVGELQVSFPCESTVDQTLCLRYWLTGEGVSS